LEEAVHPALVPRGYSNNDLREQTRFQKWKEGLNEHRFALQAAVLLLLTLSHPLA